MAQQRGLSGSDCPERISGSWPPGSDGQKDRAVEPAFEVQKESESNIGKRVRHVLVLLVTPALALVMTSHPAFSQTRSILDPVHPLDGP